MPIISLFELIERLILKQMMRTKMTMRKMTTTMMTTMMMVWVLHNNQFYNTANSSRQGDRARTVTDKMFNLRHALARFCVKNTFFTARRWKNFVKFCVAWLNWWLFHVMTQVALLFLSTDTHWTVLLLCFFQFSCICKLLSMLQQTPTLHRGTT